MRPDLHIYYGLDEITNHVISYTRNHNICTGVADGNIVIDYAADHTFIPYGVITVYEDGIKKGTFYVTAIDHAVESGTKTITFQDASKKIIDWFIDDIYTTVEGDTTLSLIEKFLDITSITYNFSGDEGDHQVTADEDMNPSSVADRLIPLLTQSGWYYYFDPINVCQIGKLNSDMADIKIRITDIMILNYNENKNDTMLRNRAVVWGARNVSTSGLRIWSDKSVSTPWDYSPLDKRTIVFDATLIKTQTVADRVADLLLKNFAKIDCIKTVTLHGYYDVKIGDWVMLDSTLRKSYSIVMEIHIETTGKGGATTTLVLDKRCPRIFADLNDNNYIYASTAGSGVWRKLFYEDTWHNYSDGLETSGSPLLNVPFLAVYDGNLGCTTAGSGLILPKAWRRNIVDTQWSEVNLPTMYDEVGTPYNDGDRYPVSVTIDKENDDYLFAVNNNTSGSDVRSWVYEVPSTGSSGSSIQLKVEDNPICWATDIEKGYDQETYIATNSPYNTFVNLPDIDWGIKNTYDPQHQDDRLSTCQLYTNAMDDSTGATHILHAKVNIFAFGNKYIVYYDPDYMYINLMVKQPGDTYTVTTYKVDPTDLIDSTAFVTLNVETTVCDTFAKTGTTTNGSKILTLNNTDYLESGMFILGTGIPNGDYIETVDSSTQVTMGIAATADGTVSVTFTGEADILKADLLWMFKDYSGKDVYTSYQRTSYWLDGNVDLSGYILDKSVTNKIEIFSSSEYANDNDGSLYGAIFNTSTFFKIKDKTYIHYIFDNWTINGIDGVCTRRHVCVELNYADVLYKNNYRTFNYFRWDSKPGTNHYAYHWFYTYAGTNGLCTIELHQGQPLTPDQIIPDLPINGNMDLWSGLATGKFQIYVRATYINGTQSAFKESLLEQQENLPNFNADPRYMATYTLDYKYDYNNEKMVKWRYAYYWEKTVSGGYEHWYRKYTGITYFNFLDIDVDSERTYFTTADTTPPIDTYTGSWEQLHGGLEYSISNQFGKGYLVTGGNIVSYMNVNPITLATLSTTCDEFCYGVVRDNANPALLGWVYATHLAHFFLLPNFVDSYHTSIPFGWDNASSFFHHAGIFVSNNGTYWRYFKLPDSWITSGIGWWYGIVRQPKPSSIPGFTSGNTSASTILVDGNLIRPYWLEDSKSYPLTAIQSTDHHVADIPSNLRIYAPDIPTRKLSPGSFFTSGSVIQTAYKYFEITNFYTDSRVLDLGAGTSIGLGGAGSSTGSSTGSSMGLYSYPTNCRYVMGSVGSSINMWQVSTCACGSPIDYSVLKVVNDEILDPSPILSVPLYTYRAEFWWQDPYGITITNPGTIDVIESTNEDTPRLFASTTGSSGSNLFFQKFNEDYAFKESDTDFPQAPITDIRVDDIL